jgi:hypothetical protein
MVMVKTLTASVAVVMALHASLAIGQTNAAKASPVGTWKLDLKQSSFGSEPPPQSVTLTILKDTPEAGSWRVDVVDDKGQSMSYAWTGPQDGTPQPVKSADGKEIGKESLKRDGDALLRHGEDSASGSSFDARSTLSADGNTITDVTTMKSKDGKTSKTTTVYRRVQGGDRGRK